MVGTSKPSIERPAIFRAKRTGTKAHDPFGGGKLGIVAMVSIVRHAASP
jgi:hypothetical protein